MTGATTTYLATANPDKAREIAAILAACGLTFEPRPDWVEDVEETGITLEANARLKAEAIRDATGGGAIADDTGLEIDALGGAPGVYSARYSGEGATYASNVAKVLEELERVGARDPESRRATFSTVAVYCAPDGREVVAEGTVVGWIAAAARGDGGFGYDPVFVPAEGDGRTFSEMSPEEKHRISHRGRAFRTLAEMLTGAPG